MHHAFRIIIVFSFLYLFSNALHAQGNTKAKRLHELQIGESAADYSLIHLINYPQSSVKIQHFKGKWLILDFWSTHCSGCIASWPKLLHLQSRFKDSIQIVLVNPWINKEEIVATFEKRKRAANVDMTLPCVCKDPKMDTLFPTNTGVPHIVWINPDGKVNYITDGDLLNERIITRLLHEAMVNLVEKPKELIKVDSDIPFNWQKDQVPVLNYSLLAKANEHLGWNLGYKFIGNQVNSAVVCRYAIRELYALAYSKRYVAREYGSPFIYEELKSHIILEVKDTSKYVYTVNEEDNRDYLFLYQLITPPMSLDSFQQRMQQDLKSYIGLNVHRERRKLPCLVLSTDDTSRVAYKPGSEQESGLKAAGVDIGLSDFKINNVSISYIIGCLENYTRYGDGPYPIIDETGIKGNIGGINIETNIEDYKALDAALSRYKMHFRLEPREIEVLVLSEPDGYKFPFESKKEGSFLTEK